MRGRACLFCVLFLPWVLAGTRKASADSVPSGLAIGQTMPNLRFERLLEDRDYATLGLSDVGRSFELSSIPGDLLVLEFFSCYCVSCQRQAPYLVSYLRSLSKTQMAARVRVLAVGVGGNTRQLELFRRRFRADYPIVPDPLSEGFLELGVPGRTPFAAFLLRRGRGWILADCHEGIQEDVELLARTQALLAGEASPGEVGKDVVWSEAHRPPLGLSRAQQEECVRALLVRTAGGPVALQIRKFKGFEVFEAKTPGGQPLGLFARIVSRNPLCDLCHTAHFIFAFDLSGRVRGFQPIHLSKQNNEAWSPADGETMGRCLLGREMAGLRFDPDVDGVTGATVTSDLIFDEIRRSAPLLKILSENPPTAP